MKQHYSNMKQTALSGALALTCIFGFNGLSQAATTFDVIGPHEYDLPEPGFKPWNVFVQYAYVQNENRAFDTDGDRVKGTGNTTTVGLSKYVRFWTSETFPSIGMAYEVIVPEISVRTDAKGGDLSGIGDPLTGFALWYKPTSKSTLGFQSFLQVPVGGSEVSDTNWKSISSLLWDMRLTDKLGWTADAGFVFQTAKDNGDHPGVSFNTNQRLGYRATSLLEPFVGLDYEQTDGTDTVKKSKALDLSLGVMFHTFDNQSIDLRYSASASGENHVANNNFYVRYVYVW
jgi:hypothetical protein